MAEPNSKLTNEKERKCMRIVLSEAQKNYFKAALKCGIYKELYKREILSDSQLSKLLEQNQ